MSYEIIYEEKILDDIKKIPKHLLSSIRNAIESRLKERPYDFKPLSGKMYQGLFRLRVGDYRIVYEIEEKLKTVKVLAIGTRGKIYQVLDRRLINR
ncbi:hypothetical protein FACS189449_10490 [Alphaproteobacteria bacterium]|nr:hypothetical protein FACS189449_10490 [Alphaproteobacteria bacterium]